MAFCCGCEMKAGEPIDFEIIKAHYKHTLEVNIFWELIFRRDKDLAEGRMKLSQARLDFFNAIEELFPEVKEE